MSLNFNINSRTLLLIYSLLCCTWWFYRLHTGLYNYLGKTSKEGQAGRQKTETCRFYFYVLLSRSLLPALYVLPSAIKFVAHAFRFINCRFLLHSSDAPRILFFYFCWWRAACSVWRYGSVCKIRRGGGITGMKSLSRTICAMSDCNLMNFKRVFAGYVFFSLCCL